MCGSGKKTELGKLSKLHEKERIGKTIGKDPDFKDRFSIRVFCNQELCSEEMEG